MSSHHFDEEYKEYMERRERERSRTVATSKSARFKPTSTEQPEPQLSEEKRAQLKGDGSYDIPNNVYHSSGYASRRSELGEDPISTVRTLRNQLRRMAIQCEKDDTPVRAHLCERACDRLSAVEGELTALGRQRSNAVFNGDTRKADQIARRMEELKEDAVRDTYSDLVMDKNEMKAFGVNSEWTPAKRPEEPKPIPQAPPTPVKRKTKPVTIQTQTDRPVSAVSSKTPVEPKKMTKSPPRDVKRNARLSAILAAQQPPTGNPTGQRYDDPYQLPNYAGSCQFCGEAAPDFGMASRLENHYKTSCMMMSKCRFCSKVVMVPQHDDHVINRCSFVSGRMTRCSSCGMAIDATDNSSGVGHPMCRGRPPPGGAQWCPLCAVAVDDTKQAWKTHLTTECYNNPRRSGPEVEFDTAPEVKSESKTRPNSSVSTKGGTSGGGRMIDANKLVAALQDVQQRKKQESLKKKAATTTKEAETQ
ncbi:hypothetical protein Y032_0260g534 [Ancylostoma ceylanicum]|uniref:Centrosomal protein CEP104 Zn finger domain-containing protein n=1 Tax=Ancylostoma ceylanicum TaxID=53326 RepID=A0A016SAG4_9BILA|nr:hypothetical protein Y032_0260g534 [Ancylostoma ceylanicum]